MKRKGDQTSGFTCFFSTGIILLSIVPFYLLIKVKAWYNRLKNGLCGLVRYPCLHNVKVGSANDDLQLVEKSAAKERNGVQGVFITAEGGEGAGKSTVLPYMQERLEQEGYEVLLTREPGGIRISEQIRQIILHVDHQEMDTRT